MGERTVRTTRATIGEIRLMVRVEFLRLLREEWWAEAYDKYLFDDPSIDEKSVLVPDDIKASIKKWAVAMGLDGRKRLR